MIPYLQPKMPLLQKLSLTLSNHLPYDQIDSSSFSTFAGDDLLGDDNDKTNQSIEVKFDESRNSFNDDKYTIEDRAKMYLSSEDYKSYRKQREDFVKKFIRMKENQNSNVTDRFENKLETIEKVYKKLEKKSGKRDEFCIRGFENEIDSVSIVRKKEYYYKALLQTQQRDNKQRQNLRSSAEKTGSNNTNKKNCDFHNNQNFDVHMQQILIISRKMSQSAIEQARTRAKNDEKEARKIYYKEAKKNNKKMSSAKKKFKKPKKKVHNK